MNDRHDPYGTGGPPPEGTELYGYDEYGRPLYRQSQPPAQEPYDPYGAASYDPYGTSGGYSQQPPQQTSHQAPHQPPGQQTGAPTYDPYQQSAPDPTPDPGQQYDGYDQSGYLGYGGGYQGYSAPPPAAPQHQVPPPHQVPPQRQVPGQYPYQASEPQPAQQPYEPAQQPYEPYAAPPVDPAAVDPAAPGGPGPHQAAGGRPDGSGGSVPPSAPEVETETGYQTEQFAFVEDTDDSSEDVIDWLKFSESRTERLDERKRRGRNRLTALLVVMVLALVAGGGYLWYTDRIPGLSGDGGSEQKADGNQRRDVIAVHLQEVDSSSTATALLVDDAATGRATTMLLPNQLAVTVEDGSTTTLGQSVDGNGAAPTRDALGALLGTEIKGTWRLDTPYLENLVETVSGIVLDADRTVPGPKKGSEPLVLAGKDRELDGLAAVAYATHRAAGEPQSKQLQRFGQVMQAVLMELSSDPATATTTVEALGQVPDPSLSDQQLGASLAHLAQQAQKGSHSTTLVPVETDGTLSEQTSRQLVKEVLGGTVRNSDPDAAVRVGVKDASGAEGSADKARVLLVNGGFSVIVTPRGSTPQTASSVTYTDARQQAEAQAVATALGLPKAAVRKGEGAPNADITVVLGQDFEG